MLNEDNKLVNEIPASTENNQNNLPEWQMEVEEFENNGCLINGD